MFSPADDTTEKEKIANTVSESKLAAKVVLVGVIYDVQCCDENGWNICRSFALNEITSQK